MFAEADELLHQTLSTILPQTPIGQFIAAHALVAMLLISALFIILFLLLALFFDFITDAWKLPFAAGVDALKFLGLSNPWFAAASGLVGVLVFLMLSDVHGARWLFALLSAVAAFVAYAWGGLVVGVLVAVFPLNTVMMFIATIID